MKYLCDNCSPQIGCTCRFENKKTECDTYVPMNNEQYIRFCSTEQLAEWIVRIVDCEFCPVKKPCKKQPCKKQIEKWLKQSHSEVADEKTV